MRQARERSQAQLILISQALFQAQQLILLNQDSTILTSASAKSNC